MITAFQQILGLFAELDRQLTEKVELFAIGGIVLLSQGLKPATKDIDLVVSSPSEFAALENALLQSNFKGRKPTLEYWHFTLSQIFLREDFRIDLFHRQVCGEFFLSSGMRSRARFIQKWNFLSLFLCSNEDIFLFKGMTEREGDLEDGIALAKTGLDWKIILAELQHQIKHTGNRVWVTWVGERFDLLQERGLNIPIMPEIDALRYEYYERLERRMGNAKQEV